MIPYGQKDFPHQARPQADPYDTHKELTAMNILPACAADTAKIYRIMTEARSLAGTVPTQRNIYGPTS